MQEWEGRLYQWLFVSHTGQYDSWIDHLLSFPSAFPVYVSQVEEDRVEWYSSASKTLPVEQSAKGAVPPYKSIPATYKSMLAGSQLYCHIADVDALTVYWPSITQALAASRHKITHELLTTLQLESLLDLIRDAVLLETKDRKIAYVNAAFCELFTIPLPPTALIGWDCAAALTQAKSLFTAPDTFVSRINDLLQGHQEVRNDRLTMQNGKVLDRDYRPLAINQENYGCLWIYRDISEIVEKEKRILQQERKYQRVLENLDVGIMEVDNEGVITKAFEKFCILVGYTEDELLGKDPLQVFNNPDMQKRLGDFHTHVKKRSAGESSVYEMPLRKKDGSIIWMQISGTPIYSDKQEVIGSLGLHFDITDRKQRQDELILAKNQADAANQAKEKFMSNLSHEMLTPMNGIMGFLNLLHEETDIPDKQRYYLNAIQNAADNLLVLLEDLLDYSRIEGSAIKFNSRVFNVSRSIQNFCSIFGSQLDEYNNQLLVEIDPKLPYKLSGDPLRIGQLVKHLTANAIKFTENGKIIVRLLEKQRTAEAVQVVLEVQDSGTGIPAAEFEKIFERFYRAERFTNRLTSGTGIGLSIVKQIVQQMNGKIELESEVGQGSTFRVHFKLDIAEDQKISRLLQQFGSQLKELLVLVAEDNTINQLLIEEHLHNWKIPHTLVDNGSAVLDELENGPFKLVLMDVQMPKMNGIEATRQIRQRHTSYRDIPIIALTAYALSEDEKNCLEAGMNDYVSKPFNPFQLLVKIIELGLGTTITRIKDVSVSQHTDIKEPVLLQYIDLSTVKQFTRGNDTLQKKLIQTMIDQEKDILIDIQTLEAIGNWEALFSLMHRLKPNVELLGMRNLIPLVGELTERFRHQQDLEEAPQLLHQFQHEFKNAIAELKLMIA